MSKPTLQYKVSTELVDNIKVYEVTRINRHTVLEDLSNDSRDEKDSLLPVK